MRNRKTSWAVVFNRWMAEISSGS